MTHSLRFAANCSLLAGSRIVDRLAAGRLSREIAPGFRVDLHHEDLDIVTSAARDDGVVIPLGAAVTQLMASLRAQGHGDLDHIAQLRLVEPLSRRGSD